MELSINPETETWNIMSSFEKDRVRSNSPATLARLNQTSPARLNQTSPARPDQTSLARPDQTSPASPDLTSPASLSETN